MLQSERFQFIMQELEKKKSVTVKQLKALLNISLDTVRRDLAALERQNRLKRVHGGAVLVEESNGKQTFAQRTVIHLQKKQQLAQYAMAFIKENQAIALNAGTTNIEVAKQLVQCFERLTIITNSLKVAEVLAENRHFTIIMPGGVLNSEEYSLYGRSFAEEISKFNIDVALIAVNAVSLEKGLTDFRLGEAEVIHSMLDAAQQKVIVADSSKFGAVSYINICPLSDIDCIVTDDELDEELYTLFVAHEVHIVNGASKRP